MEIPECPLLRAVHVLKLQMLGAESVPARLAAINIVMLKSFGRCRINVHTWARTATMSNLREIVENHQENGPTR